MPINFKPLDQQAQESSGPVEAARFGFKPLEAQPAPTAQQEAPPEQSLGQKIGGGVVAAVGGLSNAGADIAETAVNASSWLLDKVGVISPSTKKQLDRAINDDLKIFRVSPNDPDMFGKAMKEHPYIGKATELGVEIPALIGASVPALAGKGALGVAKNLAANAGVNSLISAGLAGPNTKAQDEAAMLSVPLTVGATAVGAGIKALANRATLTDDLKNLVSPINQELAKNNQLSVMDKAAQSISNVATKAQELSNKNWQTIKDIPGTINTTNLHQQLKFMLERTGSKMGPNGWDHSASLLEKPQLNSILDLANSASGLQNMDDAIRLKQTASQGFSNFVGKGKSDLISTLYKNIQSNINDSIQAKAGEAGLESAWTKANQFHRDTIIPLQDSNAFEIAKATANRATNPEEYNLVTKSLFTKAERSPQAMKALLNSMDADGSKIMEQNFIQKTFKDLMDSPEAFDKNKALLQINRFKTTFGPVLSQETNQSIQGIKKLLEKGGAKAATKIPTDSGSQYFQKYGLGGSLGAAAGFMAGGPVAGAVGAAAGAALQPAVMGAIHKLMQTGDGIKILRYIGAGKPGSGAIAKALSTITPAEFAKLRGYDDE